MTNASAIVYLSNCASYFAPAVSRRTDVTPAEWHLVPGLNPRPPPLLDADTWSREWGRGLDTWSSEPQEQLRVVQCRPARLAFFSAGELPTSRSYAPTGQSCLVKKSRNMNCPVATRSVCISKPHARLVSYPNVVAKFLSSVSRPQKFLSLCGKNA